MIMKLTTITQVSVDGVMQHHNTAGFERGGWHVGHSDEESKAFMEQVYQDADAHLLGRRTYDEFAGFWGAMDYPGGGPIADSLNGRPKYVASRTLTEATWAGTTVLSGDLAAAIAELKAQGDGELLVTGSGTLARWLLANDLVDEMKLVTFPVVVGQGARLFPADGPDIGLGLIESRCFRKGVTCQSYRPSGRPRYVTA